MSGGVSKPTGEHPKWLTSTRIRSAISRIRATRNRAAKPGQQGGQNKPDQQHQGGQGGQNKPGQQGGQTKPGQQGSMNR